LLIAHILPNGRLPDRFRGALREPEAGEGKGYAETFTIKEPADLSLTPKSPPTIKLIEVCTFNSILEFLPIPFQYCNYGCYLSLNFKTVK